jgi:hypothetical protein
MTKFLREFSLLPAAFGNQPFWNKALLNVCWSKNEKRRKKGGQTGFLLPFAGIFNAFGFDLSAERPC